ncbi:MAG: hypothetical protein ACOH1Y_09255 [Propionicimonas sp.]
MSKTQDRYDQTGSGDDLQVWLAAETDYASTPEGHAEALRKVGAGELAPGELPAEYWQRIADNGALLRERNEMIAQAAKEAVKVGDAFHAAIKERLDGGYLPESVRGPRALDRFLDREASNLPYLTHQVRVGTSRVASLDSLLSQLEGSVPDPDATWVSRVPRSEQEKHAWTEHLAKLRAELGEDFDHAREVAAGHMDVLDRFGRPTARLQLAMVEPQEPSDLGFVGRIRQEDGSLSTDAFLVYQMGSADQPGPELVRVWPLREPGSTSEVSGTGFPARARVTTGTPVGLSVASGRSSQVPSSTLERAEDTSWNRFVGTEPSSVSGSNQYMCTPGQVQEQLYDDYRHKLAEAVKAPYPNWGDGADDRTGPVKSGLRRLFGGGDQPADGP